MYIGKSWSISEKYNVPGCGCPENEEIHNKSGTLGIIINTEHHFQKLLWKWSQIARIIRVTIRQVTCLTSDP